MPLTTCFRYDVEPYWPLSACLSCPAGSQSVFRLSAHDAPTCTMSFSPACPGLLATGSTDKKVKLWDVTNDTPTLVAAQDLQVSQGERLVEVRGTNCCGDVSS